MDPIPHVKMKKDLPPEIQKLIDEHPGVVVIGMVLAGLFVFGPSKPGVDVPGLRERRNGAWRGKGSFGRAPFGKQSAHRR